ncbi:MAG: ABC transporter permease subunit [Gammaproteobacteria bacterium]|nr:ABC transporter permease subunit [Gammaproteobacteria bacterium]
MKTYVVKRLFFAGVTFFVIVTSVFFLLRLAPGGPFDGERRLPAEIEANLKAAYDLDAPLIVQYGKFMANLAQGDLGPSFKQKDFSVNELIAAGLPTSAALGITAFVLALMMGLGIGITAGLQPGSVVDSVVMGLSNLNIAVPTIVAAPMMVLVFSVTLSLFPAGGADSALHFVLPTVALAIPLSAEIARIMRGSIAEVSHEPHVKTARSKGLSTSRIVLRHMMPIACIPLISFLAPAAAGLLVGSVVVEQIFDLPGIGRYYVAALSRDYTLVMGVTIVYAFAILLFNFIVDLSYGLVDPRIRVET